MQVFLAISLAALDSRNKPHLAPTEQALDEAASEAKARIMEKNDEWEQANEEGGDGGEAVRIVSSVQLRENDEFRKGMNNARKAEEKALQRAYQQDRRPRYGASTRGQNSTNKTTGEIKYHDANDALWQEMKSKDSQDIPREEIGSKDTNVMPHLRGRKISSANSIGRSDVKAPALSKRLAERLIILDTDCEM